MRIQEFMNTLISFRRDVMDSTDKGLLSLPIVTSFIGGYFVSISMELPQTNYLGPQMLILKIIFFADEGRN